MKAFRFIASLLAAFCLVASCGEKEGPAEQQPISIVLVETGITFEAEGGSKDVTLKATGDWKVESVPDWLSFTPAGGQASSDPQKLTVTAKENTGSARSADVKFVAGEKTASLKVSQAEAAAAGGGLKPEAAKWYTYKKASKVESGKSYLLVALNKAAVSYASEATYGYMNTTGVVINSDEIVSLGRNAFVFTAKDGGYTISQAYDDRLVYLKDSYNSFQVGKDAPASGHIWNISVDNAGMFTIKNKEKGKTIQYDPEFGTYAAYAELSGTLPCLYECIKEAAAPAKPTYKEVPKWLELPQTKADDALDFYAHDMISGGKKMRNYSFDYDPKAYLSLWVAYPLNDELAGKGKRSDAWGYDPYVPVEQQQVLYSSYAGDWQRGHQLPSADRLDYDANVKTFYFTNMTPQNGQLNEGVWAELEQKVRDWSSEFDTLYVVTGCSIEGSTTKAKDNDGKLVTVPVGYYKALLGYSKAGKVGLTGENGGYTGCAFWFDNAPYSGKYMDKAMTIAELEKKIGVDLFVNLPSVLDAEKAGKVESTTDSWWK